MFNKNLRLFFLLCSSLLIISSNLFASKSELPPIPVGCFDNGKVFCTKTDLITSADKTIISVNLFATLSFDDYASVDELTEIYFDFSKWPIYAAGSENVEFVKSFPLDPITADGKKILRHYAYYYTKAPWPISRTKCREVSHYTELPPAEGAFRSIHFEAITNQVHKIPGEDVLNGAEGMKYKAGELHIRIDQANRQYVLYLTTNLIPGITLLPSVAAPYVANGIISIFKGMFQL